LYLLLLIYQKPEGQARFACMQALALLGQIEKELSASQKEFALKKGDGKGSPL